MPRVAGELARIGLALALLAAVGLVGERYHLALMRASASGVWPTWAIAGLAAAFMVTVLVRRERRRPIGLLAIEALLACALAVTPPAIWIAVFGINAVTTAAATGYPQLLAAGWLAVVVVSVVRGDRGRSAVA